MSEEPDYYEILGVTLSATPSDITKNYRNLAKIYHPDKNPNAQDIFLSIQAAYEVLSNPEKRMIYDQSYSATKEWREREREMDSTRIALKQKFLDQRHREENEHRNAKLEKEQKRKEYLELLRQAQEGGDDDEHTQRIRESLGISAPSVGKGEKMTSSSRNMSFEGAIIGIQWPRHLQPVYRDKNTLIDRLLQFGRVESIVFNDDGISAWVEMVNQVGAEKAVEGLKETPLHAWLRNIPKKRIQPAKFAYSEEYERTTLQRLLSI